MSRITDAKLKALKGKVSEPVGSRGDGNVVFWRRASGSIEAYYRYRNKGSDTLVKIGQYKLTRDGGGYTLAECRDKAFELARIRREVAGDLKEHLEAQAVIQQREQQENKTRVEEEAKRGTLKDLCESYVANLERQGRKSTRNVERALICYVFEPFPKLAGMKACDIRPDDVVTILRRMIENGITTTTNRVRSYLHAAYEHGSRSDHDPMEQVAHGKRFMIKHNPVSVVPKQSSFERVRERCLTHEEIYRLWHEFPESLGGQSPVYGLMLRFMLATAGNRPEQLNDCRWSDFDEDRRTFTFYDSKGRNGKPKKRVMPLSNRALAILNELKTISGNHEWIFSITGKAPTRTDNLAGVLRDYCDVIEKRSRDEGLEPPERIWSKDIRRTATSLLIECGVKQEQRFQLQSRGDGSVESKHYDHSDRLPEKREALKMYDALLDKILKGENVKLVDMEKFRKKPASDRAATS
ncbi:MAG: hypothetical protein B0D91_09100 [Oceanospirillales bacterium LUC14_002_19_P2]|nr:MAG: hypothetical protein B0D91_09100 [Oceanospirillales bacterium LUC14_002_19_P2]